MNGTPGRREQDPWLVVAGVRAPHKLRLGDGFAGTGAAVLGKGRELRSMASTQRTTFPLFGAAIFQRDLLVLHEQNHRTRASVPDVRVVSRELTASNSRAAYRTHESGRAAACRCGITNVPAGTGRR